MRCWIQHAVYVMYCLCIRALFGKPVHNMPGNASTSLPTDILCTHLKPPCLPATLFPIDQWFLCLSGWNQHHLCVHSCVALAGIGAAVLLADLVYDVPANVILDSARRALSGYDVITSCIKAWVFGLIISTVSARQ